MRCASYLTEGLADDISETTTMIKLNMFALLASALAGNAATMIFNNGTPDLNSGNSRNMSAFRLADDFSLSNAASVASVRFWLVDQPGNFSGNITYAFYQDSAGALGSLVVNGTATVGGITPVFLNQTPSSTRRIERVDFNLSTTLTLAIGTYWLELHDGNSLTAFGTPGADDVSWAFVSGNPAGNAKQNSNLDPLTNDTGSALAFQLFDNSNASTNAVPEPATVSIFALGLAALAVSRRRLAVSGR